MDYPTAIPPLTFENWATWKVDARVLLMHFGCWQFVETAQPGVTESDPDRAEPDPDGAEPKAETQTPPLSHREKYDLDLRKSRAYTLLYINISSELKPLISDVTTGREAWKILQNYFEPSTRARIIQLLDEFFSIRYLPDEDIGLFLKRVHASAGKLREAGHELHSLYIGMVMLRYLPKDFQTTVQQIYRWSDDEFKPDKIKAELLLESNRMQLVTQDIFKTEVFLSPRAATCSDRTAEKSTRSRPATRLTVRDPTSSVSQRSSSPRRSKRNKAEYEKRLGPCYRCKKMGHFIKDCKMSSNGNISSLIEFLDMSVEVNSNETSMNDLNCWVVDTAATAHFCNDKNLFFDLKSVSHVKMSLAVNNQDSSVEGIGTVIFYVNLKGKQTRFKLTNVLYNPSLRRNLISGSKLEKDGLKFVGSEGKLKLYDKDWNEFCEAIRKNNLYFVKPVKYIRQSEKVSANAVFDKQSTQSTLWHERFCHINSEYITNTSKNESVRGLPRLNPLKGDCIPCKLAKSKRVSFKKIGTIRSRHPLELLHMDVCGPLPVPSLSGNRYFLSIIDDFSRKVTVFPIKNKSDVFETFVRYQRRAERFLGKRVITVRTDGGLEFCNREMDSFLDKLGIRHEVTNTFSPEQNGVAERYNLTALDGVKALLNSSKVPRKFWSEAIKCFSYVWNRVCHKTESKTPFELFCKRKPSVAHLKVFGCLAYVGIPKQQRKKLDMRAKMGVMLGYAQKTKGYRIWLPDENKLIETINVRFDESKGGIEVVKPPRYNFPILEDQESVEDLDPTIKSLASRLEIGRPLPPESTVSTSSQLKPCSEIKWIRKAVPRKNGSRTDIYYGIEDTNIRLRSFNDVEKYCEKNSIEFDKEIFNFSGKNLMTGKISEIGNQNEANLTEVQIPKGYNDAMKSPEASEWQKAMNREIAVAKEREVWELVDPPKNVKILGNRWVYTLKRNSKNEIVRFKARLVAKGFSQIKGETYEEVFSPVVNFSVVRLLFAIFVCYFKWYHVQLDINNAYLYADLDSSIYMNQPKGFQEKDSEKVCLLKKALYGLCQSGRCWFYELEETLLKMNFKKLLWCNCVYSLSDNVIVMFYVDDIIVFSKYESDLNDVLKLLQSQFDLKILGKTKTLLGIEFEECDGKLFIHQRSYIDKICERFEKYKFPLSSLPIPKGQILSKIDSPNISQDVEEMSMFPYRSLIGCLAFVASRTRPDISYAVNVHSQFQSNPGMKHWSSLLKLLGYLKSTQGFKLELSKIKTFKLKCFSDSDFAANRDDRVSMGGFITFLDETPISWRTFKHKCVSLSTMEAEFVTLAEAAKEFVWLKNILQDKSLNLKLDESLIFCDNQAAISFSNSPIENHRTKHIDVRYHFIRNLVNDKVFKVKYVNSKANLADIFTKPLTKDQLVQICRKIFAFGSI